MGRGGGQGHGGEGEKQWESAERLVRRGSFRGRSVGFRFTLERTDPEIVDLPGVG